MTRENAFTLTVLLWLEIVLIQNALSVNLLHFQGGAKNGEKNNSSFRQNH